MSRYYSVQNLEEYSEIKQKIYTYFTGNCDCFSGFIGSDCSIQLSSPLEGFRLPFDGLCDSSAPRSCQTFFVIGFFHSDVIFVKLSIFVVSLFITLQNVKEYFLKKLKGHIHGFGQHFPPYLMLTVLQ